MQSLCAGGGTKKSLFSARSWQAYQRQRRRELAELERNGPQDGKAAVKARKGDKINRSSLHYADPGAHTSPCRNKLGRNVREATYRSKDSSWGWLNEK